MQPKLVNASSIPLNETSSNQPDVSMAVMGMLYPMVFEIMQNSRVNGYAQNIPIKFCTSACIQPFTPQMLKLKPEGDRAWSWFSIWSLTVLDLKVNDRIKANGKRYKIMEKMDWSFNQYFEYHAILDYSNEFSQSSQ